MTLCILAAHASARHLRMTVGRWPDPRRQGGTKVPLHAEATL